MNTIRQDVGQTPRTAWALEVGSPLTVPPAIAGGLLWLSTQTRAQSGSHTALHAVNVQDGSLRWTQPLTFEHAMVNGLAIWGDLVLVSLTSTHRLHGDGALVALDPEGSERWRWALGVQRVSAPTIDGDTVYVTADTRSLVAIDLASGQEKTRIALEIVASLFAPAVTEDAAYTPCNGPHLLAMDLGGGPRWHFELADSPNVWLEKTPLAVGDRVFAVQSNGIVLALCAEDGSLAWRTGADPEGKYLSPLATDGELLFVGARDGIYALDQANGREVWHFPTARKVEAAPLVCNGVAYVGCHDHHLYALDTTTGQELWQYEVQRRIEVSPVLTSFGGPIPPCAFVVDRGGTLTAVARPLSAAEHEAAGHWSEAASIYIDLGQTARAAELLGEHGDLLKAAELWESVGEMERAAQQCEAAGAWQKAAELWCETGWPLKQAWALQRYAHSLEETTCGVEECVAAWEAAAKAFGVEGETEQEAICQRRVARCLELPIIALDVELEKGLVLNSWSRLKFISRNEGFGPAHNLIVRAQGEQFKGQVMHTVQITTLHPEREQAKWLDVYPLEPGDSVPLRVQVDYQDHVGVVHTCGHTIYISVAHTPAARSEGQTINVFHSGSGGVAVGNHAAATGAGGVAAGGDVYDTFRDSAPPDPSLPGTTHVLAFERLSPLDFERLCLWLVEREGYTRAEHLGLAGSEQGRDVIAYKPTLDGEELWYFQCKRYASIGARTLKDEVDKYLALIEEEPDRRPVGVVFVVSCAVSAKTRDAVSAYCEQHGLSHEFWALTELDMRVKQHSDLLREFFNLSV